MVESFRQEPDPVSAAFDNAASVSERVVNKAAEIRDDAVHRAHEATAQVRNAGHRASDALHATADYLRDQDLAHMVDDVKSYTRSHPAQALLAAAAVGFLAAALIRRA